MRTKRDQEQLTTHAFAHPATCSCVSCEHARRARLLRDAVEAEALDKMLTLCGIDGIRFLTNGVLR